MATYTLICDGKVVGTEDSFAAACESARRESLVPGGWLRFVNGVEVNGRGVAVWSGPVSARTAGCDSMRGVTKHVCFACGATS